MKEKVLLKMVLHKLSQEDQKRFTIIWKTTNYNEITVTITDRVSLREREIKMSGIWNMTTEAISNIHRETINEMKREVREIRIGQILTPSVGLEKI